MEQWRLFWAVNLPAPLKAKLASLQEKIKPTGVDAKWVEKENLHLTLQFLGNVDAAKVAMLITNMQKTLAGFPAFPLRLGGLGFFPGAGKPRVFWAGIAGDLVSLRHLHEQVQKANLLSGFPAEEREFSPHLTLARLRSNRGVSALLKAVEELGESAADLGELSVTSVDLMKSELSRRGPTYTVLAAVKLRP
ncbi:MAG: RNA 2',3'-cyclic phosphodiesterase [Armatimonadetes bacterium]|nr:RNA 2',3'-cyclic phosphodiesterase [Armatimonadota bacterium]